jgi:hypothetical protein
MERNIQLKKEISTIQDEKMPIISTQPSIIGKGGSFANEINWYQSATMAKDIYSFHNLHAVIHGISFICSRDRLQENYVVVEQSILVVRYMQVTEPYYLHVCNDLTVYTFKFGPCIDYFLCTT